MLFFSREGTEVTLESKPTLTLPYQGGDETKILVMAGKPLDEPVAAHGPFVMNTEEEIRQAFADLKNGNMGVL